MRSEYRTVLVREGEWSEFDPAYDWRQHSETSSPREFVAEVHKESFDFLYSIRDGARDDEWLFSSSGFSRFPVVHVGMWDGWPFWRPVPAVGYIGPLGVVEVAFFYSTRKSEFSRRNAARKAE